ncbi:uncharacterized protein LOC136062138 [Quercus suber]|uniref:uncharacterized protein LOC136062138 n=1 Tax=Quercus suber TaxID=58331 RepID=UPI000D2CEB72|nr:uncharacterized protein CFP56_47482 [Quercus suber]
MSEASVRSREEDDVLQRSTKMVKENQNPISIMEGRSYRDKLVGECIGVFEIVFDVENVTEMETMSDDEANEDLPGVATVHLSGGRKGKIRVASTNALIVKVFGKAVGYHFLISRLVSLWELVGRMECIDLGNEFFLIRFSIAEDRAKVLKVGPWFVGGHYLSIKCWESNFMAKTAKLLAVAVWIRLPGLPIEYYEPSVLRDIGLAIGSVLRIDTQTATEVRGGFARLCVQVNFDKPIIKLIKIGSIRQPVQYEGINALCFSCGRVSRKTEECPYRVKLLEQVEKTMGETEAPGSHKVGKDHVDLDSGDFRP